MTFECRYSRQTLGCLTCDASRAGSRSRLNWRAGRGLPSWPPHTDTFSPYPMNSTTYFDQCAATWDADPMKVARAEAVAHGFRSEVPLSSAMRALEYGCGTGLLSFALRAELGEIALAERLRFALNAARALSSSARPGAVRNRMRVFPRAPAVHASATTAHRQNARHAGCGATAPRCRRRVPSGRRPRPCPVRRRAAADHASDHS